MKQPLARRLFMVLILSALGFVGLPGPDRPVLHAGPAEIKVPGVDADQIPSEAIGQAVSRAHTVYMDGSGGKKKAAERMNRLHEVMAAKGWSFAHLAPYVENGDLEGWWITYVVR